ncbi:GIY-YIG nuclease family protein [bacterium]|nr:GIY-YIG nuclease family protein [bacterium]
MYYTYILISKKDGKLYIGYTDDLKKRINKHNKGFVSATKYRRPLELMYYEAYQEEKDSKRREKYLKGGKGRKELKTQLQNTFEKNKYKFK